MYTEEEAKGKWCPMFKVAVSTSFLGLGTLRADNRSLGNKYGECNCIASECMMWKWGQKDRLSDCHQARIVTKADNSTKSYYQGCEKCGRPHPDTKEGHCGLSS